jgi:hypothetical protein
MRLTKWPAMPNLKFRVVLREQSSMLQVEYNLKLTLRVALRVIWQLINILRASGSMPSASPYPTHRKCPNFRTGH